MQRFRVLAILVTFGAWATACNQIFGIEDGNLVERPREDAGGDDVTTADVVEGGPSTDAPVDGPPVNLPTLWLFAGVDLATQKTEIVVAGPEAGTAAVERLTLPSSDAVVYASGGRAFLLDRKTGTVFVLDRATPADVTKVARIETSPSGGTTSYDSNPYAVAVADDRNAFVIRYDQNEVIVVDLTDVRDGGILEKGRVDLSIFNSTFDTDNKVEMAAAVYEPTSKRVYVALQRVLRTLPAGCSEESLVVAIEGTTGKIADLDNSGMVTKDDAIKLNARNPYSLTLDGPNNRLLALGTGCRIDGGVLLGRQVDAIDLASRVVAPLITDPGVDVLAFLYIDPSATYLQQSDGNWKRLLDGGTLGATATQIPSVPFVDREGFIVGLVDDTPDASARSWSVYRVDRQAQLSTAVVPTPFATVKAANVFFLSSALLQ